ncbi:hypothetical protein D3C75_1033260 [compost metagenome]
MSDKKDVPMVTITQEHYGDLLESRRFLNHLENWGVDNWNGYGLARQSMREEDEEDEDES